MPEVWHTLMMVLNVSIVGAIVFLPLIALRIVGFEIEGLKILHALKNSVLFIPNSCKIYFNL